MSGTIVKKTAYDSTDISLGNLKDVYEKIQQDVDKGLLPNDYYNSESLGIVIYENKYTNLVAKAAATDALAVFNQVNWVLLSDAKTQIKNILKAKFASRYSSDLTGDLHLMQDFNRIVLA